MPDRLPTANNRMQTAQASSLALAELLGSDPRVHRVVDLKDHESSSRRAHQPAGFVFQTADGQTWEVNIKRPPRYRAGPG